MSTQLRFPTLPEVTRRGEPLSSPVHWLGLQWAVTAYGVEARDGTYAIERHRILEEDHPGYSWERHMAEKEWVDAADFREAMAFARRFWTRGRPTIQAPARASALPLLEAYMAWCPRYPEYSTHPFVGTVVVGPKVNIELVSDGTILGDIALPLWNGICATLSARRLSTAERLVLMLSSFHTLTVRDRLDPQTAHRAFLAIDEYRKLVGANAEIQA